MPIKTASLHHHASLSLNLFSRFPRFYINSSFFTYMNLYIGIYIIVCHGNQSVVGWKHFKIEKMHFLNIIINIHIIQNFKYLFAEQKLKHLI